MWAICLRECKELFKGIRPILIIAILLGLSFLTARFADYLSAIQGMAAVDVYTMGLSVPVLLLGLLFVFTLSHDTINREVETRTIRFIVTKITRNKIMVGKLLGILLFWLIIVGVCLLLIGMYAKSFYLGTYLECMVFLSYATCLTLLLSTLIRRTGQSIFLGIVISLLLPILTAWAVLADKWYIQWFKYLSPYYYFEVDHLLAKFIIILLAGVFLMFSLLLFRKKDL